MRINSNISLHAQTQLRKTQKAIARSLMRLSSGNRVTSAADGAVELALSARLDAQRRGLIQATRNINEAQGYLETASAAISTQREIVLRMRDIAVQASNGTLTDQDRANLDLEVQALYEEYNRITTDTKFADTPLLDGSFGTKTIQVGSQAGQTVSITIPSMVASGVLSYTVTTSTTTGLGTFQAMMTHVSGSNSEWIAPGDFNEDGMVDLLVSNHNSTSTVSILLGNGNGTFRDRSTISSALWVHSLYTDDLNNDGHLDLLAQRTDAAEIEVFLGNGNGTFQSRTTVVVEGTGNEGWPIAGDVNADGKLDMIVANWASNNVSVLIGNGDGTFQTRRTLAAGGVTAGPGIADFNADGKYDLVFMENTNDFAVLFIGNGDGTFQSRVTLTTGGDPVTPAIKDINGDGKLDLLHTEYTSGHISIYLGNGNGTFQARSTIVTSGNPGAMELVDFNDDGKWDIVNAATAGGNGVVDYFLGNGNGTFQARKTLTGSIATQTVHTADINGDGVLDIMATINIVGNTIGTYIQNTTTSIETTTLDGDNVSVATQSDAEDLITLLDSTLENISANLAEVAASHSRLDHANAQAQLLGENLSSARSNLLDTDYAFEVAELVRYQILQQAQVAVLAQANLNLSLVLKLLSFDS